MQREEAVESVPTDRDSEQLDISIIQFYGLWGFFDFFSFFFFLRIKSE